MEPACATVNFGRSFLFISFLVIHHRVLSDIMVKPLDSETLVNELTHFNCSSSIISKEIHWYHYPLGAEAHERKSVYAFGKFYTGYQEDFSLENNTSNGTYNLVIKSVKPSYAGRYECQDDGAHRSSAQLIVLDGEPECSSDINLDGVIGPNACGIQPDELHLSCSISYHGNIPPELKWIKLGEANCIGENATKEESHGHYTYNLTITADQIKDRSSYVCQTTKSRTSKPSCTSETVKLLYIFGTSSLSVKNIGGVVSCSADTNSKSCQYKWKWYNKEDTLTVSDNQILNIEHEGQHRCEATCDLRGEKCTVNAIFLNATLGSSINNSGDGAAARVWVPIFVIIIGVLLAVLIFIICRWKHRHKDTCCGLFKTPESEERYVEGTTPLIEGVTMLGASPSFEIYNITAIGWHPELLHVESLKSTDDEKTVINGLAILGKELFVVFENNSSVKVFQAIAFGPVRSFSVKDLGSPLDMVSSSLNNALFISSPKEIFKVDTSGTVILKWSIDDGGGTLSVTHDQTVILSDWKRTLLREYSADGKLISGVKLPSGVRPFHAVKINFDQFVVSYEHGIVHRVSKFDVKGNTIQSFSEMLKFPRYLAVKHDGYIFVADRNNGRVLMMNPALASSKVLSTDKDFKLNHPSRICLNEENSRMFVADSKEGYPRFLVFRLIEQNTGTTADNPINISYDEQDRDASTSPEEEHPGAMGDHSEVVSDISDNDEEHFVDAENTFGESRGANEDIVVNQYEPLVSSHNLIEDPGGKRKRSE